MTSVVADEIVGGDVEKGSDCFESVEIGLALTAFPKADGLVAKPQQLAKLPLREPLLMAELL